MRARAGVQPRLRGALLALAGGILLGPGAAQSDADWDDDGWADDPWEEETERWLPFDIHGFVELAGGYHTRDNAELDKDYNLAEARLQLEVDEYWRDLDLRVRADAVADQVEEEVRGELREARVAFPLGRSVDLRVGRQVLSWGTGDLLFINDLFPKDFPSFLTGRDSDYLQAPSDAVRGTWYGDAVNLDLVWTPVFEPDRYPDGDRLSYFDRMSQELTADSVTAEDPDDFPDDGELAARLSGRAGSTELAAYAYRGFFPQPEQQIERDPLRLTHARLNAVGASVRDRVGPGIATAEVGYYHSPDYDSDRPAQSPNDEARLLAGYTWEAVTNLDVGLQYYLEWLQDHDELEAQLEEQGRGDTAPDEHRHVLTNRLTYSVWRDNLTWSLFTFYSPSDDDYYLRPSVRYRASDALTYTLGGNLFGGDAAHTFYGQFETDSNVYARLRYRF